VAAAELLLALDLGTTSVRALLVGPDGAVRARASRPLQTHYAQPGWVEQSPDEFWEAGLAVLREALEKSGAAPSDVAALGVVTQRSTVIAWDRESGEPLAPAIGWQDTRVAERAAELAAAGLPVPSSASALRLEWWMKNEPRIRDAALRGVLALGTPDSWLTWKLCGGEAYATDPGQASCTVLCDGHALEWSDGLCDLFSVPREALPAIEASSSVIGETPPALLGTAIRVASRAGDQQASAFAQGIHRAGQAKLTLGTSAMLDLHCGNEPAPLADGIFPLALWRIGEQGAAYCREGSVFTAGAAVDWLASLGVARDAAEVEQLARSVPSSAGVAFVPALQGLGAPFLDANATGMIGGLTRGSGRAELARAVLEGIAQRCADVIEPLETLAEEGGALRVDGGLARSEVLLQALADYSGLVVQRSAELETTALGAAFLAGLATGVYSSPDECANLVAVSAHFEPSLDAGDRAAARERWRRACASARGRPE
jgi:glycerol kinase